MIENGFEVRMTVARQIAAHRAEGREPTKILMSIRQFNALKEWDKRHAIGLQPIWKDMYGLPIKYCPDCDLYVP